MKSFYNFDFIENDGVLSGYFLYSDGDYFKGTITKEYELPICGTGRFTSQDGTTYIGFWKDCIFVEGKINYPDGDWFSGTFDEDENLINGRGSIIVHLDDDDDDDECEEKYTLYKGKWKNGKFIRGTIMYENGYFYEGKFMKGVLVNGRMITPNGYEYEIVDGKQTCECIEMFFPVFTD